jgi:hypothetical protein
MKNSRTDFFHTNQFDGNLGIDCNETNTQSWGIQECKIQLIMPPATVILLPSIPIATERSSSLNIFLSLSFRYSAT